VIIAIREPSGSRVGSTAMSRAQWMMWLVAPSAMAGAVSIELN
jgi:hypothetical protein